MKRQTIYIIIISGMLMMLTAAGAAWSQTMAAGAAKKFTAMEKDRSVTSRYGIFNADHTEAVTKAYADNGEEGITNFFKDKFQLDGVEKEYTAFKDFVAKKGGEYSKEITYYNFFGYVWTPERFNAFADDVENEYFTALKKAGFTSFGIDKMPEVDDFFVTYFKTNGTYDVAAAYASFAKKFGANDITYAAFQRYFFAPAFLRFLADETVTNIGAIAVPKKE